MDAIIIGVASSLAGAAIWYGITKVKKDNIIAASAAIVASQENKTLIWERSNFSGIGLPTTIPSTANYIRRPNYEKELNKSLASYSILCVEGPAGIGKTYLTSKILANWKNKNNSKIVWFDSQPDYSSLFSMLIDQYAVNYSIKNSTRDKLLVDTLKKMDSSNSIFVIDNFKKLTNDYRIFFQTCLKFTENLKIILISRFKIKINFPDYPGRIHTLPISKGFEKTEAKSFLHLFFKKVGCDIPIYEDFDMLYQITAHGLPRALANFISSYEYIDTHKLILFQNLKDVDFLREWTKVLLKNLSGIEIRLIECAAIIPGAISIDRLKLLYSQLHLRSFSFSINSRKSIAVEINKLIENYVFQMTDSNTVTLHDSFKDALLTYSQRLIKAHNIVALSYISKYEVKNYNPEQMPTNELNDKWCAIYHLTMCGKYEQAANILCEIYPFLLNIGSQEGIDCYIDIFYEKVGVKIPWIAYLYILRKFEMDHAQKAIEILENVITRIADHLMILRLMSLKVSILNRLEQLDLAIEIANVNIETLQQIIQGNESYITQIIYNPNLDNLLAWNYNSLSQIYKKKGETKKSTKYFEKAESIKENIIGKKNIAEMRVQMQF